MTRFSGILFVVFLVISLVFIVFSPQFSLVQVKVTSSSAFFQHQFSRALSGLISVFHLRKENQQLRAQYAGMLEHYAEVLIRNDSRDQLRMENAQLHQLLKLSRTVRPSFLTAEVVGKDASSPISQSVHLNKGTSEGVQLSAPVLGVDVQSETLAFIGLISAVTPNTSMVRLISDPSSNIAVRLFRLRNEGLLIGTGQQVVVKYIDLDSAQYVRNGDMIVTSGLSSLVPPDFLVGRVEAIIEHSHELTVDLVLTPAIDLDRMEYVFILTDWEKP